ncbi:Transcriptional regulator, LysR family protein [Minicystis rosea]|nr:Transcriptional regulator, LysR family protein [Minicystis rosea]
MDLFAAMQAFARVYETGSFSAAAKRLRTGQPAVSRLVAQLEEHLEVELFLRSTRGLSPTEAGKRFYEHAVRALESADLAERVARGPSAISGRLRISGTIAFMRRHVIPKLGAFYAEHPDIELDLLLDDEDVGLVEQGVEVAFRMGKQANSELLARRIGASRRMVVASAAYLEKHGVPLQPQDLRVHPALVFSLREGGEQLTFTRRGQTQSVVVRARMRVNALEGLRAAIVAGLGIGIVTEWVLGSELADGRVEEVLADWSLPPVVLWAVLPGGRRASPAAKAFVAFVEEQIAGTPFAVGRR